MNDRIAASRMEETNVRITRARAKQIGTSGRMMQKPPRPELKRTLRASSKRPYSDENMPMCSATACSQNKKRAVLSDVSNIFRERSQVACHSVAKVQTKRQVKGCLTRKNLKSARSASTQLQQGENVKGKLTEGTQKITGESRDILLPTRVASDTDKLKANQFEFTSRVKMEQNADDHSCASRDGDECYEADARPVKQNSRGPSKIHSLFNKDEKSHEQPVTSTDPQFVDIDANKRDPLMCSVYAQDIHDNIRVSELNCRPSVDYMDKVQRDVTQSMRRILIDWLVEVTEEYKLVPDTLYLTVNLIDRFLSCNYIEKQRLQLLGVTCMLIASKYEEISAPRVEEFCFITDNTYTKEELSVPSIKTFLRRFIQAAQATTENPSVDVEYLANYLAELTLVEYSFLKFLPSLIAASAVFLARWTIDQSVHPWNPTLEHYTSYKISDLKTTIVAIEELQLNAKNSAANAVREKYRQQKFNCVANLSSSKAVQTLFSS
ncbi:hypothetical protein V2J09_016927 [Rumex salicifolius]